MILSVSRRTDIPALYSDWFMERVAQGYVYVKNPFNAKQISKVIIKPDVVDCIVFWTRNPKPIMKRLDELDELGYQYYFQFTITPYKEDLEKNNPNKKEMIDAFIKLSQRIGKDRVILRYDPILITEEYIDSYHKKAFSMICEKLSSYTDKVIISFLDDYRKVSRNMKGQNLKELGHEHMIYITKSLVEIANKYQLPIETCAEAINLEEYGVAHARCIDGDLIEKIIGYRIKRKDKLDANRQYCGCMKCVDIGQYDSCIHDCLYCYANVNKEKARLNYEAHDPKSPILLGIIDESLVKERKGKEVESFRINDGKDVDNTEVQDIIRFPSSN